MNFLSSVYSDGNYRTYLDVSPRFCVAAVSSAIEEAEKVAQVLQQVCPRLTVVCTEKVKPPAIRESYSQANTFRLLRSNWCVKHQTSVFSCILLVCFVDKLPADTSGAQVARDLVSRLSSTGESPRCNVVFVPYSDYADNRRAELCDEIERNLRTSLGSCFSGSALQTDQDSVWRGIAALQKIVVDTCSAYHKDHVHRLRDKKSIATADPDQDRLIPRLHFKLGWHYLVLHDFSNARRQMLSGLRKLKAMFPLFPSFQSRLCGSIFLWHFLSCVSLCGGHLTSSSEVYREVRRYNEWIGSAYGGTVRDECQTITSVLTKLLEAEWLEYLVRKTENLDTRSSCDYLLAAAHALQECIAFLPSRHDGDSVDAPPHVGEEELLDEHAAYLWRCCDKAAVRSRIVRLLSEAKSLASCRETEVNYLLFLASNDLLDEVPDMGLAEQIISKASRPIVSRLAEIVCGALNTWKELSPRLATALLLHGCVDPVNYVEQGKFQQRLHELGDVASKNEVLHYPHGELLAPFTAIAYFNEDQGKIVGQHASVVVVFFSTSTTPLEIDVHTLTFGARQSKEVGETGLDLQPPRRVTLSAAAPQRLAVDVPLTHAGQLSCSCVTASVRLGDLSVAACWHFSAAQALTAHPMSSRSRASFFAPRTRTVLDVANPATAFRVECPSFIQAVEGECVECEMRVSCTGLAVTDVSMTMPHEPKLFRVVCWGSANEALPSTEDGGEMRVAVPALAAGASVRMIVSVACLRSAEFRLPISFRCCTQRYGELSCARSLHLSVDPPFNVEHALMGSNLWGDSANALQFPAPRPAYTQYDRSLLVKASDIFRSPLITNWKDDCALYFFTKSTTADTFAFAAQDTITLSCTFRCTAKKGLTLLRAEVMCGEEVELLSCCGVELDCFLEEGECATVVTRFRARRTGRLTPGLIRVLFTPQRSTARLYSDVCIPAIDVDDAGVRVVVDYPLTTARGSAFCMEVTVVNTAATPFIGELLLDTGRDDFACEAAARRTLHISPNGQDVTRYVLSPLRVGEVTLPAVRVRSSALARTVMDTGGGYVVHVLPEEQAALAENPTTIAAQVGGR